MLINLVVYTAVLVVSQKGRAFVPAAVTVKAGDSVAFVNDDSITHNVFAKGEVAQFDLKQQPPGQRNEVVFAKPGTVEVRCAIHPSMKLVVTVTP
jgi:plastocyanin